MWRRHNNRVNRWIVERLPNVGGGSRGDARPFLDFRRPLFQQAVIRIDDPGNFHVRFLGAEPHQGIAPAVDTTDGDAEAVVRPQHPAGRRQ